MGVASAFGASGRPRCLSGSCQWETPGDRVGGGGRGRLAAEHSSVSCSHACPRLPQPQELCGRGPGRILSELTAGSGGAVRNSGREAAGSSWPAPRYVHGPGAGLWPVETVEFRGGAWRPRPDPVPCGCSIGPAAAPGPDHPEMRLEAAQLPRPPRPGGRGCCGNAGPGVWPRTHIPTHRLYWGCDFVQS